MAKISDLRCVCVNSIEYSRNKIKPPYGKIRHIIGYNKKKGGGIWL